MPTLKPQIGDIWKYDTTILYAGAWGAAEHWLILDSAFIRDSEQFAGYPANLSDYFVQYIHLETGDVKMKVFHDRDWGSDLDLYNNPYYKKVA
jgi:hypothetical protein